MAPGTWNAPGTEYTFALASEATYCSREPAWQGYRQHAIAPARPIECSSERCK